MGEEKKMAARERERDIVAVSDKRDPDWQRVLELLRTPRAKECMECQPYYFSLTITSLLAYEVQDFQLSLFHVWFEREKTVHVHTNSIPASRNFSEWNCVVLRTVGWVVLSSVRYQGSWKGSWLHESWTRVGQFSWTKRKDLQRWKQTEPFRWFRSGTQDACKTYPHNALSFSRWIDQL